MSKQKAAPVLRVGDLVTIPDTTYPSGRIVEARGRLGPGGAQIFRVRIPDKPTPIYIELREDQLELRHHVTTLTFDQIADRLRPPPARGTVKRLTYPDPIDPFVPQTITAEEFLAEQDPLASDVLLFKAPAAVGKSTFARALAARTGIPVLDLAKVKVSTGALSGILEEIGDQASHEFQQGEFALIIDALDEGRIFSGDSHIEEFLRTTVERLAAPAAPKGQGPKLLLFGRPAAVELAAAILELDAPSLPVTRLAVDYFDEAAATELVLAFARKVGDPKAVERHLNPIRQVICVFFDAISAAIGMPPRNLWEDDRGRSFAGYAPVLASVGTLIAADKHGETPNYAELLGRLKDKGATDAWEVLETVANEILDREAKVRVPLAQAHGAELPANAYDRTDQLDLLANLIAGQTFRPSPRLAFGSPAALAAYRNAVEVHLPEHPFLHDNAPVNDVLGALVVAHAVARGQDVSGGQMPKLLAEYGRQPFFWRFIRHRLSGDTLIEGEVVSYVLGSVWTDDSSPRAQVRFELKGPNSALLGIRTGDLVVSAGVALPLVLRGEILNLDVELPGADIVFNSWPGSDTSSIAFIGRADIRAGTIKFHVNRIHIGALGVSASCHLNAENALNDQEMVPPEVHRGSELTIQGVFEDRYPWQQVATAVRPSTDADPLGRLLADCEQRIQGVVSLVTLPNFDLTDDQRVDWAREYGDLLPRLLRALVDADLAKTHVIQTKRDAKIRVSPSVRWAELRRAYERPSEGDPRLRDVLQKLN
ncbi:MAG TPA: hypothetical protein VMV69_24840 [Pirellulales bacterium]|nr:hypothetical protein [Pirellulales bacterium]